MTKGDFTFFRISTDDTKGTIKAYLGTGEITDDPYVPERQVYQALSHFWQTISGNSAMSTHTFIPVFRKIIVPVK